MENSEKNAQKLKKLKLEEIKLRGKIEKLQYEIENNVFSRKNAKKAVKNSENAKKDDSGWI